jgi:hypothetical protein
MKWLFSALICSVVTLQGLTESPVPQKPPAYDADLFKRDVQVFSFYAEFLYWRVQEGALDYALKMRHPAWSALSDSFAQGKFEKATFNGDPGIRVGASFFRAPKYWEMWVQYTRLTARGQDSSGKPDPTNEFLTGTWPQIMTDPLSGANTHIHLNYNVADVLVDRYFNPNPHLRLRLIGGGTVAWINQDWKIHYTTSAGGLTKVRNRWAYIGGGFRVGTIVDWFWGYDIYVTASASTGVLMGSYRNRAEQVTNFTPGGDTSVPVRKADYRDARPAFTVQALLGPSWQKNCSSTRVEVFAGYELNTWLNLQEVYRSTGGPPSVAKETWINTGMLTLQGLTTRVTVDF